MSTISPMILETSAVTISIVLLAISFKSVAVTSSSLIKMSYELLVPESVLRVATSTSSTSAVITPTVFASSMFNCSTVAAGLTSKLYALLVPVSDERVPKSYSITVAEI